MKTIIISCDRYEVEEQTLQHIIQYLRDLRCVVSLSTLGPNTHFISVAPEVANEPVAAETPPETVEIPPEQVAAPSVEQPNYIAPTLELPPEPELTVDAPTEPFSSTCKIWDLASQVSVPCSCKPSAQSSVLCVSHCDARGDYVLFTYAGMIHKVPKATMIDGCCNKEPIPTDSSIRVSLSIGNGGIYHCLLNVTCDSGEERVILGSDLEHLISPTEVENTNGSVSTQ